MTGVFKLEDLMSHHGQAPQPSRKKEEPLQGDTVQMNFGRQEWLRILDIVHQTSMSPEKKRTYDAFSTARKYEVYYYEPDKAVTIRAGKAVLAKVICHSDHLTVQYPLGGTVDNAISKSDVQVEMPRAEFLQCIKAIRHKFDAYSVSDNSVSLSSGKAVLLCVNPDDRESVSTIPHMLAHFANVQTPAEEASGNRVKVSYQYGSEFGVAYRKLYPEPEVSPEHQQAGTMVKKYTKQKLPPLPDGRTNPLKRDSHKPDTYIKIKIEDFQECIALLERIYQDPYHQVPSKVHINEAEELVCSLNADVPSLHVTRVLAKTRHKEGEYNHIYVARENGSDFARVYQTVREENQHRRQGESAEDKARRAMMHTIRTRLGQDGLLGKTPAEIIEERLNMKAGSTKDEPGSRMR